MKKIINFIVGLVIVFAVLYCCNFLLKLLKISFPAPILGIIFLFILLKKEIIKEELVKDFCEFILKYMILFFIPSFVGIIRYLDIVSKNIWAILLTVFLSTAIVIVFVSFFMENAIKFQRLAKIRRRNAK
ncbi:CidA/LrgA family protein [bacterium]|nr:CidA/LrgA family protein [bacterium]